MAKLPNKIKAEEEVLETYEEWQEFGYHVRKGEKARSFNKNNQALFSEDQVEQNEENYRNKQSASEFYRSFS